MDKYVKATAKDLADTLLKHGEVSFAAQYETDGGGAILDCEGWYGAAIINQFNGQCILVTGYGGGLCFAYNVTNINDIVPVEVAESVFAHLFRHDLKIPGETVCIEEIPASGPDSGSFEFNRLRAHVGHNIKAVLYGDGVNVSVECTDCHEVIYSVDNPAAKENEGS